MNPRLLSSLAWFALVTAGFALGLSGGTYALTMGISAALFAVLATAFNLVYGYAGLLCLAQVAFLGIGAYGAGILQTRLGWSFWTAAPTGAVVATAFGLLIGYASLRLSRHSFGIATLTASLLCMIVARDWVSLTRGSMGIPGLPPPRLDLAGASVVFDAPSRFYWLAYGFAVVSLIGMRALVTSRIGRAFLAVKGNEALARSQGLRALHYRLLALGVSAFVTGLAGALLVAHLTIVDPSIFDFYYTETMLIMVVVGGLGHFWAVIVSSLVFTILPELLRFSPDLRMVLYGLVLMVAMLAFPQGIAGVFRRRRVAAWRRRLAAAAGRGPTP